jgi:hypothetical protein
MTDQNISQACRIYEALDGRDWVSLKDILALNIACHTRRIHELRKAGHVIEMKDEWVSIEDAKGKWIRQERHVWYRLVKPAAQPKRSHPEPPKLLQVQE